MTTAQTRRGHGEDSVYFDQANSRYVGAVSLGRGPDGKRVRRKVTGRTKSEVRLKLRTLRQEMATGARTSARYTVARSVEDWLEKGLDGRSPRTVELYEGRLQGVVQALGAMPLRDLTPNDVHGVLAALAKTNSTRTMQMIRLCLERAIRLAEINGYVTRNVASLVKPPQGKKAGRPSKSLTPEQASALLAAARNSTMHAYITLSLTTGLRTEEIRALRWDHVHLDEGTVDVYTSVRAHGDTKTRTSRRTLKLPRTAVVALRQHKLDRAGDELVFTSSAGTPLDRHNVLREFRKVTEAAGLGRDWAPRELRHSFVSVMSANGVPIEEIARLAGHSTTRTTELVYRRELRPVITTGAEVMDKVFGLAEG
jgi:integrase